MLEIKETALNLITNQLMKLTSLKVNVELFGSYILPSKGLRDVKSFNTKNVIITEGSDISQIYDDFVGILDMKVSDFQEKESGNYIVVGGIY